MDVRIAIGAAALVTLVGACKVFDPTLYEAAERANAGQSDAGVAPAWQMVSDHCPLAASNILNSDQRQASGSVSLNALADDIQTCGKLTDFGGPDGVFGLSLASGEKVHIDVDFAAQAGQATPDVDLGVYMMQSCDPATCLRRVDRCLPGRGEQFEWLASTAGTVYFGFDTKAYDQSALSPQLNVVVTFPRCGDGILDKGETCDDGNRTSGDGCTSDCLAELRSGGAVPVEVEPNNEYGSGNVLVAAEGETVLIKGHIGGGCDLDFFFLDIPEGGFARVTLLGQDGKPCPAGTPELTLEFDDPSGVAELGVAEIPAKSGGSNWCPQWDEKSFLTKSLHAGRYVVELKPFAKGAMPEFTYAMKVEILGKGGSGGGS